MKHRTFVRVAVVSLLGVIVGIGWCVKEVSHSRPATSSDQVRAVPQTTPAPPPLPVATLPQSAQVSTADLQSKLAAWLVANGDRRGQTKLVDIMPSESFRATAIRFPDADAAKWSDDARQWSQIRFDLNRDGRDDEKWLLKSGHIYKREVLDSSGKTLQSEWFK